MGSAVPVGKMMKEMKMMLKIWKKKNPISTQKHIKYVYTENSDVMINPGVNWCRIFVIPVRSQSFFASLTSRGNIASMLTMVFKKKKNKK